MKGMKATYNDYIFAIMKALRNVVIFSAINRTKEKRFQTLAG